MRLGLSNRGAAMTAPKLKDCPACGHQITVYTYDSGWRRAECDHCDYIAEPAQNIIQAARNHNSRAESTTPKGVAR